MNALYIFMLLMLAALIVAWRLVRSSDYRHFEDTQG